jgi:epoxyqueuosine reductase
MGFERWRRNLAVALGNGLRAGTAGAWPSAARLALSTARNEASPVVREHIDWALAEGTSP